MNYELHWGHKSGPRERGVLRVPAELVGDSKKGTRKSENRGQFSGTVKRIMWKALAKGVKHRLIRATGASARGNTEPRAPRGRKI